MGETAFILTTFPSSGGTANFIFGGRLSFDKVAESSTPAFQASLDRSRTQLIQGSFGLGC
jgi:hypothetical protein